MSTPYWLNDFRGDGGLVGPVGPAGLQGDEGIQGGVGFASGCCPRNRTRSSRRTPVVTDPTGNHYVQLNFDGEKPDLPVMVSANASVTDVNRQSFASNLELLVHPSSLYVGIRSTQQFVREGDPIDVESIVTDIDGKVVSGRTVHDHCDAGREPVRERRVGRDRRRPQALHRDVVDQAGVVLDQGRSRAVSTRSRPS